MSQGDTSDGCSSDSSDDDFAPAPRPQPTAVVPKQPAPLAVAPSAGAIPSVVKLANRLPGAKQADVAVVVVAREAVVMTTPC